MLSSSAIITFPQQVMQCLSNRHILWKRNRKLQQIQEGLKHLLCILSRLILARSHPNLNKANIIHSVGVVAQEDTETFQFHVFLYMVVHPMHQNDRGCSSVLLSSSRGALMVGAPLNASNQTRILGIVCGCERVRGSMGVSYKAFKNVLDVGNLKLKYPNSENVCGNGDIVGYLPSNS